MLLRSTPIAVSIATIFIAPTATAQTDLAPPQLAPPQMGPQKPWGGPPPSQSQSPAPGQMPAPGSPKTGVYQLPTCAEVIGLVARLTFDLRLLNVRTDMASLSMNLNAKSCSTYEAAARARWAASQLNAPELVSWCNEKIPEKVRACFGVLPKPLTKAECDAMMGRSWDMQGTMHAMRLCRNRAVQNAIEADACRKRNKSLTELFKRIDAAMAKLEKTAPKEVSANACPQSIH